MLSYFDLQYMFLLESHCCYQ